MIKTLFPVEVPVELADHILTLADAQCVREMRQACRCFLVVDREPLYAVFDCGGCYRRLSATLTAGGWREWKEWSGGVGYCRACAIQK